MKFCTKSVPFRLFLICIIGCFTPGNGHSVILTPLAQQYLPYDYEKAGNTLNSLYGVNMDAVEASCYDVNTGLVYAGGKKYIHIVDYSNVTDPTIVYKTMSEGEVGDVEICGSKVAFLLDGNPGSVALYDLYDADSRTFTLSSTVEVGYGPSAMLFNDDCEKLIVSNEGQPFDSDDGESMDPEGSIAVVQFTDDSVSVKFVNFTKFNDIADELVAEGVRWPIRMTGTTFSQSLEPESMTINTEVKTIAYISLQENNAIAQFDLIENVVEAIYALGTKSWKNWYMDASDMDYINFHKNDIYSFYQPDGLQFFEVNGEGFIITANEGEAYEDEIQRGIDFVTNDQLSDEISEELKEALNDDENLGRLEFSKVDGQNPDNTTKFDKLHFFGGRGISVLRAQDMSHIWDSENELEFFHVLLYQDVFNANLDFENPDKEKPSNFVDQQSDNKGPECESVAVGELNGTRVLFVGVEGSSSILVYSFADGSVEPRFESMYRHGGTDKTFSELLDDRNLGDLNPEDLRFISAEHSSTGNPLLLVTGTASGTLAMYEVTYGDLEPPPLPSNITGLEPPNGASPSGSSTAYLVLMLSVIFSLVHRFYVM